MARPCFATQWNAALYDDECLLVVPRSHRRARTEHERHLNLAADGRGNMPGYPRKFNSKLNVLEKNGCGFLPGASYSTTIIYCIVPHIPRPHDEVHIARIDRQSINLLATLHGCMSSATHAGPERARVILQHNLAWMRTMDLKRGTRAAGMRDRLVNMADHVNTKDLGYSLEG